MLSAARVVGALVLVKAVDVVLRGPDALPAAAWVVALAVWVAGGLVLAAGRDVRVAWAAVLVGGLAFAVDLPLELRRQHLVLLMGVALAAAVAGEPRERLLLWRLQLTTLYGFAALAKANESFLGGDVLARTTAEGPLGASAVPSPVGLIAVSVAFVVVEVLLAVTPWVAGLRRFGTGVAAVLHTVGLVVASASPLVGLRLLVFGGVAVALHAASAGLLPAGAREVRPFASSRRSGR